MVTPASEAVRVVTMSATYGAGGSVIAPRLADRLGLPFADRLIPARDAPASTAGAEGVTDEERRQSSRSRFLARLALLTGGLGLPVPHPDDLTDPVRARVEQSIRELVDAGGAVILGRGGAVVLAGHPSAFHVRLDGPQVRRVARATAIEAIDEGTARARLDETDRARARYVDQIYGRDAADGRLYHLVLDSTCLAIDECVQVLAAAAEAFWEHAATS
jgi:cytidylate kinase